MDRTRRGGGVGEGANLGLGDAHGERRGRATSSVGLTVSHSDEAPSGILPRMGQFLPRAEASSIWPRAESINKLSSSQCANSLRVKRNRYGLTIGPVLPIFGVGFTVWFYRLPNFRCRHHNETPRPPRVAAMSADGVITGRRPYRFLDETSTWNGAVRLSSLILLPLMCIVGGILLLTYETGWANHEDRDSRDMAWDYRVTAPGSNNFHAAYFRRAHWNTYLAIEAPATLYKEVVLAAVDRPAMLALHPTGSCERTVQVLCTATKPEHRSSADGPLNLGTDDGSWAIGNERVLTRSSGVTTLTSAGTAEPVEYANAAALKAVVGTRLAELNEMRLRSCSGCSVLARCDSDHGQDVLVDHYPVEHLGGCQLRNAFIVEDVRDCRRRLRAGGGRHGTSRAGHRRRR